MSAVIAVLVTLLVVFVLGRIWWRKQLKSFSKEKTDIHYSAFKDGWDKGYEFGRDELYHRKVPNSNE